MARNKKTNATAEADAKPILSHGKRQFLYATAATTGACILIVEILGAKMLSPFLGTSHFVWTAQIGVTLLALSGGYYAGGSLVDRRPDVKWLFIGIIAAGVYLCATVPAVKPVCLKLMSLPLAWSSLLAAMFLFLIPLALLAMTGPFLVRMLTESVDEVGTSMGRLTAISTVGSVLGVVLIGYVLIPHLPNSITMLITAGILIAWSAIYLIVWGRTGTEVVLVAVGLCVIFGISGVRGQFDDQMRYNGQKWDVLYRSNSNYGELQVIGYPAGKDGEPGSYLELQYLNDQLIQNTYDPRLKKSRSHFTGALRWLAHAYTPRIERALCIGMGVGVVPMQFVNTPPEVDTIKTDVVEINGAVVPLAEKYFDFNASKVNLTIGDGRQFINATPHRYDAIVLDAFLGDSSPSHLMTREAFLEMREHLTEQGVLVINTFGESTTQRQFFASSLYQTLQSAFGEARVRVHASGLGNVFFVATRAEKLVAHRPPHPPDEAAAEKVAAIAAAKYENETGRNSAINEQWHLWIAASATDQLPFYNEHPDPRVTAALGLMWFKHRTYDPHEGIILTDDFNPVDFHEASNRDANRRGLIRMLQPNG